MAGLGRGSGVGLGKKKEDVFKGLFYLYVADV